MLQPPFYLPSKVRIFGMIFVIRVPSKPSIVFSPQKPFTVSLLSIFLNIFLALISSKLIIASPDVNKKKGVAETAPLNT